jgi:hypothetical protein
MTTGSITYVCFAGRFNMRESNPKFTANSLMEGEKLTNEMKANKKKRLK